MDLVKLSALRSKEVAAIVDKACRYFLYGCAVLATGLIVALAIATDACSFEVGVGAIPTIIAAMIAVEKTVFKSKEEKQ